LALCVCVCVCVFFFRFFSYLWEGSSAWCFVLFCVCRVFALFPEVVVVGKAVVMQMSCNWVKNDAGEMAQVCDLGGYADDSSLLRSSRRGRREARNTGFSVFCIYIQFRFCFCFVTRVWRWRWSLETGFFPYAVKCVVQLLEKFAAMG
jgi:hypothetical protein